MRIDETTFSLNIKVLGTNDSDAKVQVENLEPFSKDEFWEFLIRACKAGELPKSARPSREVWRDTKESPQPKKVLKEMDEFNQMYKKFKRKFPQASQELLTQKTREYLESRRKILEDLGSFEEVLRKRLAEDVAKSKETAQPLQKATSQSLETETSEEKTSSTKRTLFDILGDK